MRRLVGLFSVVALPLGAQGLSGPGVSIDLAQHRARTIRDVRYDLALDVPAPDSAIGRVTIQWARSDSGDAIIDFRGRRLNSIVVNGASVPLSAFNRAHIILPQASLVAGENSATLSFAS